MDLDLLRIDVSKMSKKGLHFILASVIIWCAVSVIWLLPIENSGVEKESDNKDGHFYVFNIYTVGFIIYVHKIINKEIFSLLCK